MAPCTTRDLSDQRDQPAELAQKHPQVAQDHADVVTAAVQHREEVRGGRGISDQLIGSGLLMKDRREDGETEALYR